ncbi:MAG: hypothetical protein ACTH2Q_02165 [Propionibacteriaceae bacterium]
MSTLNISPLPESRLHGVTETITDETEIPEVVGRLLALLDIDATAPTQDVILVYDGITDENVITVSAAVVHTSPDAPDAVPAAITLPPADQAAIAHFDQRPGSTADAWIALDAGLESKRLRATGPYRQTLHASGAVTLATPVAAASRVPDGI